MKYILLISLFIISCSKNDAYFSISEEKKNDLKSILKSDSLQFIKNDNEYKLIVKNCRLTTELGEEMGASISSLILYDQIVSDNPSLNHKTIFRISYLDKNLIYTYTLQDLSDVIKAQTLIDNIIINLKLGKNLSAKNFDNEALLIKLKKVNFDSNNIGEVSFAGFQLLKKINKNDIISIRVFINQSELWFDLDKRNEKIVKIDIKD